MIVIAETTFRVEIVDEEEDGDGDGDGDDGSFEEPPPPYSYSEELLHSCIPPTDNKHDHDWNSTIASLPKPKPKPNTSSQKKRKSRFRECFVFWKASEFNAVVVEETESIGKAQLSTAEPAPVNAVEKTLIHDDVTDVIAFAFARSTIPRTTAQDPPVLPTRTSNPTLHLGRKTNLN